MCFKIQHLSKIQNFINEKKNETLEKIDISILKKANIVNKKYNKIKILGSGEIKKKIDINADFFSKTAEQKLKKVGGSIISSKKI